MRRYIDITDIEIPSDENDYDELVAFADAIAEQEIIQLPERKKGKWIVTSEFEDCRYAKCNQCKVTQVFYYNKPLTNFCPNCGADMKGKQE